jgi:hypothetical protein
VSCHLAENSGMSFSASQTQKGATPTSVQMTKKLKKKKD